MSSAPGDLDPPPPEKLDPAGLELRGRPPRPVRFKHGVIVGAAGVVATALSATVWLSLHPHHGSRPAEEGSFREPKGPAETVKALPADYSGVPKLGPPLPGDLGRPILERQRQLAQESGMPTARPNAVEGQDRRAEEVKAARRSGLLFPGAATGPTGSGFGPGGGASGGTEGGVQAAVTPTAVDLERDPNAQSRKVAFAGAADTASEVNPHRLTAPSSPYMISAGSVITASLITGLRSDLPGLVTAQVTENVFDSATGQVLLVPQGARLIGAYDSVVAFGQRRALVVWQRLVMPDGSAIRLENEPAADRSGYAGVADSVDFHTWTLLKGVAVSTLLGAGTNFSLTGESDLVQAIRESAQQNAANAGNQLTSRNLQIQPTITVRPGFRIVLLVHRDLILTPWRG